MRVDRARVAWLAETLDDGQVADIVGCCRRTVLRVRQEMDIPARYQPRPLHEGTCAVEPCDRDAAVRGWCHTHYQRWRLLGETYPDVPIGASPGSRLDRVTS